MLWCVRDRSRPEALCPVCKASTEARWRPFCSKRCADVNLGRWVTGRYAIATDETPGGNDENA